MKVRNALVTAALGVGLGVILLPGAAHAEVTASVSSNAVNLTATGCSGPAGATFRVTGPDGRSFDVSSPGKNTTGFATAGFTRGTYRFTGKCANGTNAGSGSFVLAPVGGPMGGDGGRSDNTLALATGTALLGAAAGGLLLMRKRATATR